MQRKHLLPATAMLVSAAAAGTAARAAALPQVQTDNILGVPVASLDDGATTLKVAGDAQIVSYSAGSGSAEATIQFGSKDSPGTGSDRRSVVDLAIALGMPPDKAQAAFGTLAQHAAQAGGPPGVMYSAMAAAPSGNDATAVVAPSGSDGDKGVGGQADSGSAASGTAPASRTAATKPWTQYCASVDGGSKKRVHSYGCTIRYKDHTHGADWWIADEATASGWSTNEDRFHPDRLLELRFSVVMPPGNILSKWSPSATMKLPDSCQTVTVGITSPETGASYSSAQTVCSDTLGPYISSDHLEFGAEWRGEEPSANFYEGATWTALWHSPPSASASGYCKIYMRWT